MLYIYCFVQGPRGGNRFPRGFGGQKVRLVSGAGIGVLVSEGDPTAVTETITHALVHQKVVSRALVLFSSVLPCRFGVWMPDEERVIALLRKNRTCLETCLARLKNKVEVAITVLLGKQPDGKKPRESITTGEKYLLEKRAQYRGGESGSEQGRQLALELNHSTSPFWITVKTKETSVRHERILQLYYLIEREQLGSFRAAYKRVCQQAPARQFLYTGPWPPYTFAEVTLS